MSKQLTVQQQQQQMVEFITSRKGELAKMLPKGVTEEHFERAAKNAVMRNPDLAKADKLSLYDALMRCSQDGLMPDGREAIITAYKDKATYQPMIDGVIKRVMQSGLIDSLTAKAVYEKDEFDYYFDEEGEHLNWRPCFSDKRGKLRLVFATAKLKTGTLIIEIMTLEEINKVKSVSRGGNSPHSSWNKWYERMALKSVLHRIARRLPSSSEISAVIDTIERDIDADFGNARDITPRQSGQTATERMLQGALPQPQEQQAAPEQQVSEPQETQNQSQQAAEFFGE